MTFALKVTLLTCAAVALASSEVAWMGPADEPSPARTIDKMWAAVVLCPPPKTSWEMHAYRVCLHRHGLVDALEAAMRAWKVVPTRW